MCLHYNFNNTIGLSIKMETKKAYSNNYREICEKSNSNVDEGFIKWIDEVETAIYGRFNVYLHDIPDEAFMISYEDGCTTQEMIEKISDDMVNMFSLFVK